MISRSLLISHRLERYKKESPGSEVDFFLNRATSSRSLFKTYMYIIFFFFFKYHTIDRARLTRVPFKNDRDWKRIVSCGSNQNDSYYFNYPYRFLITPYYHSF